jgi:hypothetical protein
MRAANSLELGELLAPLEAANFRPRAVSPAYSPLNDVFRTPLAATTLRRRAMCDANPPFPGVLRASLVFASFRLRAMCTANSPTLDELLTTLAAAFPSHRLHHRVMRDANSIALGGLCAPLAFAFRHSLLTSYD